MYVYDTLTLLAGRGIKILTPRRRRGGEGTGAETCDVVQAGQDMSGTEAREGARRGQGEDKEGTTRNTLAEQRVNKTPRGLDV